MRILIVNVHFAPDSYGGATVVVEAMARGLQGRGHEVTVLTSTTSSLVEPRTAVRYEALRCPVIAIGLDPSRSAVEEYEGEGNQRLVSDLLRLLSVDVVLFHSVQGLGVKMVEEAVAQGIPTAVFIHDSWWFCQRHFMMRPEGVSCRQWRVDTDVCSTCVDIPAEQLRRLQRSKEILNSVHAVLAPSEFWRGFIEANDIEPALLEVARNGIQRPMVSGRREVVDQPVRFGFVGGVGPGKGSYQIVEALKDLDRDDYELIVVDAHTNLGRATIVPSDFDVPGRVRVVPGYTAESTEAFFAGIDVLLAPSQVRESYGLAVREAMVHGVWPVVTDGSGAAEDVMDGVNGTLLHEGGSALALRAAVDRILSAPQDHRIKLRDIAHVATPEQQVAQIETILERISRP